MKKLFILNCIVFISFSVFAQRETGTKFGIKAGVTFATVAFSHANANDFNVKPVTSFFLGGSADFPISPVLSIQPGISLVGTGSKHSSGIPGFMISVKKNVMYVQVPVNLVANFNAGPGKFFVGAGPYFGLAVSGKGKIERTMFGENETENIKFKFGTSDDSTQKSIDFGLNFLGGYKLSNGINLNVGYGLGLSGIIQVGGSQEQTNRVLSVGLGYSF